MYIKRCQGYFKKVKEYLVSLVCNYLFNFIVKVLKPEAMCLLSINIFNKFTEKKRVKCLIVQFSTNFIGKIAPNAIKKIVEQNLNF